MLMWFYQERFFLIILAPDLDIAKLGVPQGSNAGPVISLLFANNLPDIFN